MLLIMTFRKYFYRSLLFLRNDFSLLHSFVDLMQWDADHVVETALDSADKHAAKFTDSVTACLFPEIFTILFIAETGKLYPSNS